MTELGIEEAWGLAVSIGLGPDPEQDRPALDELADAMLVWTVEAELEPVTTAAVERIWDDELALEIRRGLEQLTSGRYGAEPAKEALAELDRAGPASAVARAVVQFVAQQLSHEDTPITFCMCDVDEAVRALPEGERRASAVQAAIVARRDAAVREQEATEAARAHPLDRAAAVRALATDERRAAVRLRLGRLSRLARTSMPELAAELSTLAGEAPPADPAEDDVWLEVARALLDSRTRPELN